MQKPDLQPKPINSPTPSFQKSGNCSKQKRKAHQLVYNNTTRGIRQKWSAMALKVITFLVVVLLSRVGGDVIPKVLSTRNLMELAAPVSQKIQNERCRNHSEIYLRDLKMLKLWAAESECFCVRWFCPIFPIRYRRSGTFYSCSLTFICK